MKKTALCILVCALCTAALFADITYVGQNCGQATFDKKVSDLKAGKRVYVLTVPVTPTDVVPGAKLSKEQWNDIYMYLDKYDTRKGDTFLIYIHLCYVVIEFTSDTQFQYWAVTYSYVY
ncbi:MAG: hypothetical protein Pg6C_11160 [Treponemataceae bacterium]|nr:MAG: hypothetical protein Pg6C_11160 [Treponemataceae bacterium]